MTLNAQASDRNVPGAVTRLYFEARSIGDTLPRRFGKIELASTANTAPLPGKAGGCHSLCPFFVEHRDVDWFKASSLLASVVFAFRIASYAQIDEKVCAVCQPEHNDVIPITHGEMSPCWGHYADSLQPDAIIFAEKHYERLYDLSGREKYNRLSNALSMYQNALRLPPDPAIVLFMAALEGLFSGAMQELSQRLALSIACFLESSPHARLDVYDEVRSLYEARSKIVHGDRITSDNESAAIFLVENVTPRLESLTRRCIRKLFDDGIDGTIETIKRLDRMFSLLCLGFGFADALQKARS